MLWPIPDHHLGLVGVANEICRAIQVSRKTEGFLITDTVLVELTPEEDMMSAISLMKQEIQAETNSIITYNYDLPEDKKFTLDLDLRLRCLKPDDPRRIVKYGMRIRTLDRK